MNHRGTETQRDSLTEEIVGAAVDVHRVLGPGLLEAAYQVCLCVELALCDLRLGRYPTGLLLNFNVPVLKDGIRRMKS
jgi:hypothetical protein